MSLDELVALRRKEAKKAKSPQKRRRAGRRTRQERQAHSPARLPVMNRQQKMNSKAHGGSSSSQNEIRACQRGYQEEGCEDTSAAAPMLRSLCSACWQGPGAAQELYY